MVSYARIVKYYGLVNMNLQHHREISILSFWHKLEFFSPFDAKQRIAEAQDKDSYRSFSIDELNNLPQDQSIRQSLPCTPDGKSFAGASIYLNLFKTNKISQKMQEIVQEELSEHELFSQEILEVNDSITCFAKLEILANGTLDIQNIELSAVPWALGLSIKHRLSALNIERFEQDCMILKEELAQINNEYSSTFTPDTKQHILSPTILLKLINALNQWAYNCPLIESNDSVIGICLKWQNKPDKKDDQNKDNNARANNKADIDEDDQELTTNDIGILNSFYAKDIHSIIRKINQGKSSPALSAYLKMTTDQAKVDLYQEEGDRLIWENLQPKYWNLGRWPSEPAHGLSLMQQFAVNTFFKTQEQPVFSVNGPPGTGKTTLLRDIFAENLVRRATVLAGFGMANEAFGKDLGDGIRALKPDLTGFEMVVASSNNAAVENISRDLPQKSSIAKVYQSQEHGNVSYLELVARNLVAKQGKKYKKLPENQEVWGLFSCAMGKKANRNKAISGLFFTEKQAEGYNQDLHQSIWEWRKNYKGIGFEQAKQNFLAQKKLVEQKLEELQYLCELHEQVVLNDNIANLEQQYAKLNEQLKTAKQNHEQSLLDLKQVQSTTIHDIKIDDSVHQAIEHAKANQQATQKEIETCQDDKIYWQHKLQALQCKKPSFFAKLFQLQQYKEYQRDMAECHTQLAQLQINENKSKQVLQQHLQELQVLNDNLRTKQQCIYQQRLESANNHVRQCQQQQNDYQKQLDAISEQLNQLEENKAKYKDLLNKFPQIKLPTSLDELRQNDFQIAGLWQDEELNHHRSCLFEQALQLHEAWLAEVSKLGCGFYENLKKISGLLQGNVQLSNKQILAMWQSLFMIIPVISSTFASVARQFQGLDANSLGYLFIDEAGQAVPQAAVGAIWRSKRVMAVGDPVQIEPVFTTPPPLVRHLEAISNMPQDAIASPLTVSVQILADKYNRFGANVTQNDESVWIGSPLRVHRRCLEPMFGIANKIAYEDKMILSETNKDKQWPSKEGLYLGESSWVQVVGKAAPRQFVQEQADVVIQKLINILDHTGKLPDLYIISPFKKIADELIKQISENPDLLKTRGLKNWCNARIGTVHTFQGKEERVVWLVLGCDEQTAGAAQWAASKPNLLNVALTRAKRYVFIFGNKQIWADKPYFDHVIQRLPEISSDNFLSHNCELIEKLE